VVWDYYLLWKRCPLPSSSSSSSSSSSPSSSSSSPSSSSSSSSSSPSSSSSSSSSIYVVGVGTVTICDPCPEGPGGSVDTICHNTCSVYTYDIYNDGSHGALFFQYTYTGNCRCANSTASDNPNGDGGGAINS
jgi:hypothetical protein